MPAAVISVDHPLVQHKLTLLRRTKTSTNEFRSLLREIGWFLGAEALKDIEVEDLTIDTPVCETVGKQLKGKKLAIISILRAGDGLLTPLLDLVPSARVGQIGLARDEETLMPYKYSMKVPNSLDQRTSVVVDPMLATGGSAIYAIDELKKLGAKDIRFICLVAAPEGIAKFQEAHPDVPIITASVDEKLNENGYIVPGLGDAGDRIFGTKQYS